MNRHRLSSTGAFNSLPIELNKVIAHELETDADIAAFRLICRATKDAIDADGRSFWRAKFREKYDMKEGLSNTELSKLYKNRARQLRWGTEYSFFRGHKKREKQAVRILRDIIVGESFQGSPTVDDNGCPVSNNQTALIKFIRSSKILLNDRRASRPAAGEPDKVDYMLAAVKLMCSHFLFNLDNAKHVVFGVEESQREVYLPTNKAPIYEGPDFTEINMPWLLHNFNFFRHHMLDEDAATLFGSIDALSTSQKPSAWRQPLQNGTYKLSKHWKGTYSYLDQPEIKKIRRMDPESVGHEFFIDKNIEDGKIQSLELDFLQDKERLQWPTFFEERLQSLRNVTKPNITTQGRSKPRPTTTAARLAGNLQFEGRGEDLEDDFSAIGWLNPLPPQQGIPGWQRITFMKHFMDDLDQIEQDNLWAYEGVVLPGGRIILGRWWYASERVNFDKDYNGPFILWAVDPEPELE